MPDIKIEDRLMEIEMTLANQERTIDDLNQVIIRQGKLIDGLLKQQKFLFDSIDADSVRPLSEETPPPHY